MGLLAKTLSAFGIKGKYPSEEWLDDAAKFAPNTPDLSKLQEKSHHLIFVYGTMQRSHGDFDIVRDDSIHEATGFTTRPLSVFKMDLGRGSYPIAMRDKYALTPYARLRGELLSMKTENFDRLDSFVQGQVLYNPANEGSGPPNPEVKLLPFLRRRAKISIPYRVAWSERLGIGGFEMRVGHVEAWMYFGNPNYWNAVLDNGYLFPPVQRYAPRNVWSKPYYAFNKTEYGK